MRSYFNSFLLVIYSIVFLAGCSVGHSGRTRTIRETIDLWTFSTLGVLWFDSVMPESLKGVHLAGAGLLNNDVLVTGKVQMIGAEGTYLILEDSGARMLVDLTHISTHNISEVTWKGRSVMVHGEVKTGEKGHIYLLANIVREG